MLVQEEQEGGTALGGEQYHREPAAGTRNVELRVPTVGEKVGGAASCGPRFATATTLICASCAGRAGLTPIGAKAFRQRISPAPKLEVVAL
jgi:hypothetical protein